MESIAPKIGCVPQTLLTWVKQHEVDAGTRDGVSTVDANRMKELERKNKELRRASTPYYAGQPTLCPESQEHHMSRPDIRTI